MERAWGWGIPMACHGPLPCSELGKGKSLAVSLWRGLTSSSVVLIALGMQEFEPPQLQKKKRALEMFDVSGGGRSDRVLRCRGKTEKSPREYSCREAAEGFKAGTKEKV